MPDTGRALTTHEVDRNGQRQSEGQSRDPQARAGESEATSRTSFTVRGAGWDVVLAKDRRQENALMRLRAATASILAGIPFPPKALSVEPRSFPLSGHSI
jgi:hypothetical protein